MNAKQKSRKKKPKLSLLITYEWNKSRPKNPHISIVASLLGYRLNASRKSFWSVDTQLALLPGYGLTSLVENLSLGEKTWRSVIVHWLWNADSKILNCSERCFAAVQLLQSQNLSKSRYYIWPTSHLASIRTHIWAGHSMVMVYAVESRQEVTNDNGQIKYTCIIYFECWLVVVSGMRVVFNHFHAGFYFKETRQYISMVTSTLAFVLN
jgi:hypothetical protein